jgi:divalent metal cation (Fe/Co/Zn/Cd) transporter
LADPIVGLVISIAIFILLWGAARAIGRRVLDGVDPSLVAQAEDVVGSVPGITGVEDVRLRWTGHRLSVDATVTSDPAMPVGRFHELEHEADQIIRSQLSGINAVRLNPPRTHRHPGRFSCNRTEPCEQVDGDARRSRRCLHAGCMLY